VTKKSGESAERAEAGRSESGEQDFEEGGEKHSQDNGTRPIGKALHQNLVDKLHRRGRYGPEAPVETRRVESALAPNEPFKRVPGPARIVCLRRGAENRGLAQTPGPSGVAFIQTHRESLGAVRGLDRAVEAIHQ
jgi:hypothetical protein